MRMHNQCPGPSPRPRMPVHLKPPICHPHGTVPVVPQRHLAWAHEPDWAVLASVASASLTGPWTSPALRAPWLASETQHSVSAAPRPCLGLGPASEPIEVSQPKAQAAPRSVTNRFMLSREVPTVESLKPQRDTGVDEAALSVQTTRQPSPCPVWHTPHWDSRIRGPSNLECSFLLRPCCLLQNPCFLKIDSPYEALQPLPVPRLLLAVPICKQQKPQLCWQNVLSHR